MIESIELRIPERHAKSHIPDGVGIYLGEGIGDSGVRKVTLRMDDPLVAEISRLQREFHERGEYFFLGWDLKRKYAVSELRAAPVLQIWSKRVFEPAGEECGTSYDDTCACPLCGAGASPVSALRLPPRKIPRVDWSRTIAGEYVVSERVMELFEREKLVGARFAAVESPKGEVIPGVWQIRATSRPITLSHHTRVGKNPLCDDGSMEDRCLNGDTVGLNLLSEAWAEQKSYDGSDFFESRQYIGVRRGLLRPERLLFVSNRAWKALTESRVRGLSIEVAHLVG